MPLRMVCLRTCRQRASSLVPFEVCSKRNNTDINSSFQQVFSTKEKESRVKRSRGKVQSGMLRLLSGNLTLARLLLHPVNNTQLSAADASQAYLQTSDSYSHLFSLPSIVIIMLILAEDKPISGLSKAGEFEAERASMPQAPVSTLHTYLLDLLLNMSLRVTHHRPTQQIQHLDHQHLDHQLRHPRRCPYPRPNPRTMRT